jgi:hypothetical protein
MNGQPDDAPEIGALADPLKAIVNLFDTLRIPYALVGGIAAMVYGRPRFTEDIDLVASSSHEQILQANGAAMSAHGFDPSSTWKLYHTSGVEIDIWKDQYADDIANRAKSMQFFHQQVRIAEVNDLVAMKLRAGRLQDDYDISEIIKRTAVDEEIIRGRTTPEQFSHLQTIKARTRF